MSQLTRRACLARLAASAIAPLSAAALGLRLARAAPAPAYTMTVSFGDGTCRHFSDLTPADATPLALLQASADHAGFTVATVDFGAMGALVTRIGDTPPDPSHFWYYWINGQLAPLGVSRTRLAPGDHVSWIFVPRASARLFIRGDANADGIVDISDPVRTLLNRFHGHALSCEDAADANDDGQLDISDPVATLNHLFLNAGPLPSPFPCAGLDATADQLSC